MKISLHAEFDTPEEWSAFIDMLSARPVDVRMFGKPVVVPKDREITGEPEEQERPSPATTASAPVAAPAPAEVSTPPSAEPAAVTVEPKRRGRGKKQEAAEAPPTTPDPTVIQATLATKPTTQRGGESVTRDDLMKTFASYVQRYGTNFGYTDVSKMLTDTFGPGVRKSSDVTDDNLAQAVAVVSAAIEGNPFSRKRADVS